MYRRITPEKIKAARGDRTRKAIALSVENKVTEQDIYNYEKGACKPTEEKLRYLLAGLDTTYEAITEPVELAVA